MNSFTDLIWTDNMKVLFKNIYGRIASRVRLFLTNKKIVDILNKNKVQYSTFQSSGIPYIMIEHGSSMKWGGGIFL